MIFDSERSIDIDTLEDFERAKIIYKIKFKKCILKTI